MRKKRKLRARTATEAERVESGDAVDSGSPDEADLDDESADDSDAESGADGVEEEPERDAAAGQADADVDVDLDVEAVADAEPETAPDPDAELAPAFVLDQARLESILESLLLAAERPLTPLELRRLIGSSDGPAIQAALDALMVQYRDRGVALYDVAGGYQFRTHPSNSEYVQRLIAGRPVRLSRAQLETLSIIAYRQPVTRPEIDEIRGVDSGSTLKVLLDRSLIRVLGKKEEPGRPLLYGTSKEFLEFFNLSELRDLPTLREFHELTEESLREVEALDHPDGEDGRRTTADPADPGDGSHARGGGAGGQADGDQDGGHEDGGDEDGDQGETPPSSAAAH